MSVADLDHFDLDPDPAFHLDTNPYPDHAFHLNTNPDPDHAFKFDTDTDPYRFKG